jgi:hypothetical protein
MKKFIFLSVAMALLLLPCLRAFGDITLLDTEKNKLQLTGFFKLDAVYQDAGVNGLTFPRYAVAGDGNSYLTVSHSRFGFKYAGLPLNNGMNVSAVLEWDFFDATSANQMKFRFRQGFFSLQKDKHTILFGQTWDLFSPLGPTTLMTNGYLWQTGNLGFRHAQIRYAFSGPHLDFAVALNDPATSGGWKSKMPVLESRLGLKLGANNKFQFGLSGIYGRENTETNTAFEGDFKDKVNIAGVSLDWNLASGKLLSLKGEFARGENLSYVSSRANFLFDPNLKKHVAKEVSSFWSELLLTKNKFSAWLGYAFEDLLEQMNAGETKKTSCLLAGIQYAAGSGVSFGLEFAHFLTVAPMLNEPKTNQLIFSAILSL